MRKLHQRPSGAKLSVIIAAIVFFAVAATFGLNTGVGYFTQKSALAENTLSLNRITANEMSRTTQTILTSMQDSLKSAAEFFAVSESEEKRQQQIDFLRNSVPYFNSVVLVDRSGYVQFTSPEALGIKGTVLTSEETKQALNVRKPLISKPYRASTDRLIILVSHPVYGPSGEYEGFLGGSIYLQEPNILNKILGGQEKNENGSYYYVVDSSGALIYHPERDRIGDNVAANEAVRDIMAGQGGQKLVENTKGVRYLAGYSPVEAVGWGIISQTPAANVESESRRMIASMAIFAAPLLVLLLALVIWLANRLTSPLYRIVQLASRFNRGESPNVPIEKVKSINYETNELYQTVAEAFRMMGDKTKELSAKVFTDPLTGLRNRRFLDDVVAGWVAEKKPFSVVMMDLDRFKLVNDTYGHQIGDEMLKFFAGLMQETAGRDDCCCRYGGEEFTLLLPGATAEQAVQVAEKLRMRVECEISPAGKPMTLSLGVSSFPDAAADGEELIRQADGALYEAKQGGRNRTVAYKPEPLVSANSG